MELGKLYQASLCFSCSCPLPLPSLLPLLRQALKLLMDLIQHCSRSFLITKSCHMRILLRGEKALTSSSNAKLHSVLVFSLGMVTLPKSNCFTIRTSAACSFSLSHLAVQRPSETMQANKCLCVQLYSINIKWDKLLSSCKYKLKVQNW